MKIIMYQKGMPLEWGQNPLPGEKEEARVKKIIRSVAREGDKAVIRYTRQFDGYTLTPRTLQISPQKIAKTAARVSPLFRRSLKAAIKNIRKYHQRQVPKDWKLKMGPGSTLAQRVRPIDRVGVYVPGGENAYPSSLLMNVIPARVAGVKDIIVATPPQRLLENAVVCAALQELSVTQAYGMGGAQAIAALAFGTRSVPAVDKIVGPGSRYVQCAKRLLYGMVGIDIMAGPSEVVVLADRSAPPAFVAADLIAQAEHTGDNPAICITSSRQVAGDVVRQLTEQLKTAARKKEARRSLNTVGRIIVVKSLAAGVELCNRIAPEHLQIMTKNPQKVLKNIRHAGSIFIGPYSPVPLGDFFAGTNHVLPTGRTARFFSPLGVADFMKRSSVTRYNRAALSKAGQPVTCLAAAEGLEGHARAISIRLNGTKKR